MRLIPQTREHAETLFPLLNDDRLYTYIGGNPLTTLDKLRERFTRLESTVSPDGRSGWLNWVIEVEGVLVGSVQATVTGDRAFLAWVVGTAWQGRGYATKAMLAAVKGLRVEGVETFEALIHPKNLASQKLAAKLGLVKTAEIVDGEDLWSSRQSQRG